MSVPHLPHCAGQSACCIDWQRSLQDYAESVACGIDQIRATSKERFEKKLAILKVDEMEAIEESLYTILAIY
jgi:mRNA-degrading endonuclease toxin of MazEF toxin-antitoxin module